MKVSTLPLVCIALANALAADGVQSNVRDLVKELGTVEMLLTKNYPPFDLQTIAAGTALVVHAVVLDHQSTLSEQDKVRTDYRMQVLSVISGSN